MEKNGLLQGYIFDNTGVGNRVGWHEVETWKAEEGSLL